MKFEVYRPNGEPGGMVTYHPSCIPYSQIDSLARAGYRFRVDGKVVSKNNIRTAVEASQTCNATNPKHAVSRTAVNSNRNNVQIRCITNGKVYNTQSAAAKDLGIDPAQVSDSIKTGRPRSGYRFERVLVEEVK